MDLEEYVKNTLLNIRSMPDVIEEETLIAAACRNILGKMAASVRELLPEKNQVEPAREGGRGGMAVKPGDILMHKATGQRMVVIS
jgi:hypothetical protein